MSDFPGAIDYYVDPSRTFIGENDHKAIVCHGTGGSASQTVEQLGDYFRTTPLETSVHYGIGRDGRIAQYCPESAGAGGNGLLDPGHDPFWDQYSDNPNKHSLSFETINDSSNSLPLTDPQKQTTFKLVAYWVKKYNIPLSNIKGHFSLEPAERAHCPGSQFPWDDLWNYLKGAQQPMTPSPNQLKAAINRWVSVRKDCPQGTGIYQSWLLDYTQGIFHGPPTSLEYSSNDWSGNPIIVQEFSYGWCEWSNGTAHWYKP